MLCKVTVTCGFVWGVQQLKVRLQTCAAQALSVALDLAEREGRLNFSLKGLSDQFPAVSAAALESMLKHLSSQGRLGRSTTGKDHWFVIPTALQSEVDAPREIWLHHYYSKILQTQYYVALLTAAGVYAKGADGQNFTHVVLRSSRREISVGSHRVSSYSCARIEAVPVRWYQGAYGGFFLSSPEYTALDLIGRRAVLPRGYQLQEVVSGIFPHFSQAGLRDALHASYDIVSAKRLSGWLGARGYTSLGDDIDSWLEHVSPSRSRELAALLT